VLAEKKELYRDIMHKQIRANPDSTLYNVIEKRSK
jgi:hypothetical protein